MVPHVPPKDTATDKIISGAHVGSQCVRDFITQYKPDIAICGHIHESSATDKIGNTLIINAGMFSKGGYIKIVRESGKLIGELKAIIH